MLLFAVCSALLLARVPAFEVEQYRESKTDVFGKGRIPLREPPWLAGPRKNLATLHSPMFSGDEKEISSGKSSGLYEYSVENIDPMTRLVDKIKNHQVESKYLDKTANSEPKNIIMPYKSFLYNTLVNSNSQVINKIPTGTLNERDILKTSIRSGESLDQEVHLRRRLKGRVYSAQPGNAFARHFIGRRSVNETSTSTESGQNITVATESMEDGVIDSNSTTTTYNTDSNTTSEDSESTSLWSSSPPTSETMVSNSHVSTSVKSSARTTIITDKSTTTAVKPATNPAVVSDRERESCPLRQDESTFGKYGIVAFAISLSIVCLLLYAMIMMIFMPRLLAKRNAKKKLNDSSAIYRKKTSDLDCIGPATFMTDVLPSDTEFNNGIEGKDLDTPLPPNAESREVETKEENGPAISSFLLRQSTTVNTSGIQHETQDQKDTVDPIDKMGEKDTLGQKDTADPKDTVGNENAEDHKESLGHEDAGDHKDMSDDKNAASEKDSANHKDVMDDKEPLDNKNTDDHKDSVDIEDAASLDV